MRPFSFSFARCQFSDFIYAFGAHSLRHLCSLCMMNGGIGGCGPDPKSGCGGGPLPNIGGGGPLPNTGGDGPLPNIGGGGPLPNIGCGGPLPNIGGGGPLPNSMSPTSLKSGSPACIHSNTHLCASGEIVPVGWGCGCWAVANTTKANRITSCMLMFARVD